MSEIIWNHDSIVALLNRSDLAVERALVTLFNLQTTDEQNTNHTHHHNSVGFSHIDADIFSSFAKYINSGRHLSVKQLYVCRKSDKHGHMRIGKYWRQLLVGAQIKGQKVDFGISKVTKAFNAHPESIENATALDIKSVNSDHDIECLIGLEFTDFATAIRNEREIVPAWGEW